jgi:3'-phosphoadenosine 5'-phosphosulfate sulfotransferase (PAPS reductase)/FAD synthetase
MEQHIVVGFGGIYSAYTVHELKKTIAPEAIKLFFVDLFSDISDEPLYLNNAQFMVDVASKLDVELVNVDLSKNLEKKIDTILADNIAFKLTSFAQQITQMYRDLSKVTVHFPSTPHCLKGQNNICVESVENEWADMYEIRELFENLLPKVNVVFSLEDLAEEVNIKATIQEEWELELPRSERKRVHIAMFSGGAGSAYVSYYMVQAYGKENCKLFFTNTLWEDEDNLRFMDEVSEYIGLEITEILDGRTPEEVFYDMRFLGNSRLAKCSEELKVRQTLIYLEELRDNEKVEPILYFGIAPHEKHRRDDSHVKRRENTVEENSADMNIRKAAGIRSFYAHFPIEPIETRFPLIETLREDINAKGIIQYEWGIKLPRMYTAAIEAAKLEENILAKKLVARGINGFSHANCGGRCVRGGFQHYATLYAIWPDQYKEQEDMENRFREHFEKNVSILKKNGGSYTLKQYREDMEADGVEKFLFQSDDTIPCVCSFS